MWQHFWPRMMCFHPLLVSPNCVKLVGLNCFNDGPHCLIFTPCKSAYNSRNLFISLTVETMCSNITTRSANVISSFKHWESLVFSTKRSQDTSCRRSHRLCTHLTSSPMELYQISHEFKLNSNFLVLGLNHLQKIC